MQGQQQPNRTFRNREAPAAAREVALQPSVGRSRVSAGSVAASPGAAMTRGVGSAVRMNHFAAWISFLAYEVRPVPCACDVYEGI